MVRILGKVISWKNDVCHIENFFFYNLVINFLFHIHDADPERPESNAAVAHCVWLQLQIVLQQRKADPRMLFACFVTKPTLAAALPEQHTKLGTSCHGPRQSRMQDSCCRNTAMCCSQQKS